MAGYAYQEKWKTYNERTILVVDLGGGTTDFAFIRQEPNSGPLRLLAPSGGGGNPSGKTFDMALAAALRKAIHSDFDDLPDKADQLRMAKENSEK